MTKEEIKTNTAGWNPSGVRAYAVTKQNVSDTTHPRLALELEEKTEDIVLMIACRVFPLISQEVNGDDT